MNRKILLLVLIVFLGFLLRFYKITTVPPSLYVDEVSEGYNAYSILKTTRDEHGVFMPLVFEAFGEYKAPLYIYLLVPTIVVFGLGEFAIRLPSALFGTLTIFSVFFLAKALLKSWKTATLGAFLFAISPWSIQFSRAGFEANLMLFLLASALALMMHAKNNPKLLYLSAVLLGLSVNTYLAAKILVPLLLIILAILYKKEVFNSVRKVFITFVIIILFYIPTVVAFGNLTARGNQVTVLGQGDFTKVVASNYLYHFSLNFLFMSGDSIGRHAVPGIGELYVFELPFVLIGLFYLLRDRNRNFKFILACLLIAPVPAAIAQPAPHALRSLFSVVWWSLVCAYGLRLALKFKINRKIFASGGALILLIALNNLITYLHLYYVHYPKEKAIDWGEGYKEMVTYVFENKDKYDEVDITGYWGHLYIYLLFWGKVDPGEYQMEEKSAYGFGKFKFFESGGWEGTDDKKHLVITTPANGNPDTTLKEISAHGEKVFRIWEYK